MNKTSFTRMLDQALPGQESKKMVPHIFRVYDENNDGFIDFAEFMESVILDFQVVVVNFLFARLYFIWFLQDLQKKF